MTDRKTYNLRPLEVGKVLSYRSHPWGKRFPVVIDSDKLDGSIDNVCPIHLLPSMSDCRKVVYDMFFLHQKDGATSEPKLVWETTKLSHNLGITLKCMLYHMGSIDLWPYIWDGSLAVSGSVILQLLDHMPNARLSEVMPLSDVDIYVNSKVCSIDFGDSEHDVPCRLARPHACNTVKLVGFKKLGTERTQLSGYTSTVFDRPIDSSLQYASKLPCKVQLITKSVIQSVREFDLPFLSNYYTAGVLEIYFPSAFVSQLAIVGPQASRLRIEKYRARGYAVLEGDDVRGATITVPEGFFWSRNVMFQDLPIHTKWVEDGKLRVSVPSDSEPYVPKPDNNALRKYLTEGTLNPTMELIRSMAELWRTSDK